jgi:aminoglycoside phosphotransferase (APT) family kinase protein
LNDFEQKLSAVLDRAIPGFHSLELAERLSGGASQETYRLQIKTAQGDCTLAMRRAPGGAKVELITPHPGLEVEARLMRCAREAGVPEPEVLYILGRLAYRSRKSCTSSLRPMVWAMVLSCSGSMA